MLEGGEKGSNPGLVKGSIMGYNDGQDTCMDYRLCHLQCSLPPFYYCVCPTYQSPPFIVYDPIS